jgi:RNA polymerase sigma-32 factor
MALKKISTKKATKKITTKTTAVVTKSSTKKKAVSKKTGVKSLEKTKAKSVVAEIVDNGRSNFKDVNLKNKAKTVTSASGKLNKNIQPEEIDEQEELSPLEFAAKQAESAYEIDDDSFPDEDDIAISDIETPKVKNIATDTTSKSLVVKESTAITTSDPLLLYLNEIRRYPLLTKEQEIEITKKYFETKDPESAQLLVRSNLRFVVKIAAEYSKFGAKLIDLIQEGNVGLMHAVREYNPYKGARLITYAVWWIRGYIQEYLMRQYSMVRIGTTQNQRKLFYQLQREKATLDSLGKEQNLSDIAKKLDIPEEEVKIMAQRMSGRDISLDRPIDDDSPTSLSDFQKATTEENIDDSLAREELISILQEKVSELEPLLSDREKIILKERLLNDEPLTLQEIGEKYGITREAVRQMEVRLLKKIKDKMGNLT